MGLAAYVTSRLFSGNAFDPTHALVSFVVPYAVKAALKAYADWFAEVTQEPRQKLAHLPRFQR